MLGVFLCAAFLCARFTKCLNNYSETRHRKHLRSILGIAWPKGVISNAELYRRCDCQYILERVRKARRTLLGHILRMDDNSPASLALRYAVSTSTTMRGRRGRPRCNLFSTIVTDLQAHNISLKTVEDLTVLRDIAADRVGWRNMFVTRDFV